MITSSNSRCRSSSRPIARSPIKGLESATVLKHSARYGRNFSIKFVRVEIEIGYASGSGLPNKSISRYVQQLGSPSSGNAILPEKLKDDELTGSLFGRFMISLKYILEIILDLKCHTGTL